MCWIFCSYLIGPMSILNYGCKRWQHLQWYFLVYHHAFFGAESWPVWTVKASTYAGRKTYLYYIWLVLFIHYLYNCNMFLRYLDNILLYLMFFWSKSSVVISTCTPIQIIGHASCQRVGYSTVTLLDPCSCWILVVKDNSTVDDDVTWCIIMHVNPQRILERVW